MQSLGIRTEYMDSAPTTIGKIINVDSYMPYVLTITADIYLNVMPVTIAMQTTPGGSTINVTKSAVTIQRITLSADSEDIANTNIIDYLKSQASLIINTYQNFQALQEQYGSLPASF